MASTSCTARPTMRVHDSCRRRRRWRAAAKKSCHRLPSMPFHVPFRALTDYGRACGHESSSPLYPSQVLMANPKHVSMIENAMAQFHRDLQKDPEVLTPGTALPPPTPLIPLSPHVYAHLTRTSIYLLPRQG